MPLCYLSLQLFPSTGGISRFQLLLQSVDVTHHAGFCPSMMFTPPLPSPHRVSAAWGIQGPGGHLPDVHLMLVVSKWIMTWTLTNPQRPSFCLVYNVWSLHLRCNPPCVVAETWYQHACDTQYGYLQMMECPLQSLLCSNIHLVSAGDDRGRPMFDLRLYDDKVEINEFQMLPHVTQGLRKRGPRCDICRFFKNTS